MGEGVNNKCHIAPVSCIHIAQYMPLEITLSTVRRQAKLLHGHMDYMTTESGGCQDSFLQGHCTHHLILHIQFSDPFFFFFQSYCNVHDIKSEWHLMKCNLH